MVHFIFGMQINIKVFNKLILSFWVYLTRHAQSTQNKFVYLPISPEKHGGEVDFLPADKHKNFLQGDSIILGVHSKVCPKYPKQQVYNIFPISQGKHEG